MNELTLYLIGGMMVGLITFYGGAILYLEYGDAVMKRFKKWMKKQ